MLICEKNEISIAYIITYIIFWFIILMNFIKYHFKNLVYPYFMDKKIRREQDEMLKSIIETRLTEFQSQPKITLKEFLTRDDVKNKYSDYPIFSDNIMVELGYDNGNEIKYRISATLSVKYTDYCDIYNKKLYELVSLESHSFGPDNMKYGIFETADEFKKVRPIVKEIFNKPSNFITYSISYIFSWCNPIIYIIDCVLGIMILLSVGFFRLIIK